MSKPYDYLFKLLMIGDSAVGKTSVLNRFVEDNFNQSFIATIGIDFKLCTIELDGKKVKLQVWDTAGQERFRTITTAYYRGAMGIMLVYDITQAASLTNIRTWMGSIAQHASGDVEKMLLGNKCDLADQRVVPREQGEKLASEYRMRFLECSAKSGDNVDEAFALMARDVKEKLDRRSEAAGRGGGSGAGASNGAGVGARGSRMSRLRKSAAGNRKLKCSLV